MGTPHLPFRPSSLSAEFLISTFRRIYTGSPGGTMRISSDGDSASPLPPLEFVGGVPDFIISSYLFGVSRPKHQDL